MGHWHDNLGYSYAFISLFAERIGWKGKNLMLLKLNKHWRKIKVIIGGEEQELDYINELESSFETVNEDLAKQPSLYAYYATLYEMAEAEFDDAERIFNEVKEDTKIGMEICEAQLDANFRKTMSSFTEPKIKNAIKTSDIYIRTRSELIGKKREAEIAMLNAKKNAGLLKAIRNSFAQRKDTVVAKSANWRAQMQTDLVIKEKYEKDLKK